MGRCTGQMWSTSDSQSKRQELRSPLDEPSHFLQELPVKSPKGTVFISGNLFSTSWEIEAAQTFMRKHLLITGFALVIYLSSVNSIVGIFGMASLHSTLKFKSLKWWFYFR